MLQLRRIRKIFSQLAKRTSVQRDRYDILLITLAEDSPFHRDVVVAAGKKEAMARIWLGYSLMPKSPDVWAFRMFGRCLETEGAGAAFVTLSQEQRRIAYRTWREKAECLWAEWLDATP